MLDIRGWNVVGDEALKVGDSEGDSLLNGLLWKLVDQEVDVLN